MSPTVCFVGCWRQPNGNGDKIENTKGVVRSQESSGIQYNGQQRKDKKTIVDKTIHRKGKVEE